MSDAAFRHGVERYKAFKYADALEYLNEAVALGGDQYVFDSRAAVLERLGRYKEALADARKTISIAPNAWQGYARAARLFFSANKLETAISMVDRALERVENRDTTRLAELSAFKMQILDAQDVIDSRCRELAAKHMCHFNKLPDELLLVIFTQVVAWDALFSVILSHVCTRWRAIVLDTPAFWRALVWSDASHRDVKWPVWCKRSRGYIRDLNLVLGYTTGRTAENQLKGLDWKRLEVLKLNVTRIDPTFSLFNCLPKCGQAQPFLPSLRRLEVTGRGHSTTHIFTQMRESGLEILKLDGVQFEWETIRDSVSELHSLVVITDAMGVRREGFITLLDANWKLHTLVLDYKLDFKPWQSSLPTELTMVTDLTTLPNLRHLELKGDSIFGSALCFRLKLPALEIIHLEGIQMTKDFFRWLTSTLAVPSGVTVLRFKRCPMGATALVGFLGLAASALQTLEVCGVDSVANELAEELSGPWRPPPRDFVLDDEVASALSISVWRRTESLLCPRLTSVNFSGCTDLRTGPLVRLVKSRLGTTTEESGVCSLASLVVDGCEGIEASALPWLRSVVPHFSCVYMTRQEATKRQKRLLYH